MNYVMFGTGEAAPYNTLYGSLLVCVVLVLNINVLFSLLI